MTIKKAYVDIVEFLKENADKKVKSILDDVISMASAQRASAETTSIRNSDGEVIAIRDAYSERWCALVGEQAVEFGIKANTSTGFNPYTKQALNQWNKQQREAKQAGADLLQEVAAGNVQPTEINDKMAEIEAQRVAVIDLGEGFDSKDDLLAYLEKEGVDVDAKSVETASN